MRIFLIWTSGDTELTNLISSLKQNGHEVVYWIGLKKYAGKFPEIILHDHFDAWVNIPPKELSATEFDPPGEELILKLHTVESIMLTMMNKHFEGMCVSERKRLYYGYLRYWRGIFNKFKPEAIIFDTLPHTAHAYLIFELARLLNIKISIFLFTWISDRLVQYDNFWEGNKILRQALKKNSGRVFSPADLSEDIRSYYEFQINKQNDITPFTMKSFIKKHSLKNRIIFKSRLIAKSLADFTLPRKVFSYFKKILGNNVRKEYARVCESRVDFAKKFVYVALHEQPECTTSPMGGIFVDQILMVEILAAAVPDDWLIYVKEHPAQWLLFGLNYTDYRYQGFYKQLARIKKVRLLPINTDTFFLIDNSQAVATVTGNAGWEAIMRSKPALVFGYPWYLDCPEIFKVKDVDSCRAALQKIAAGCNVSQQSVINYLKSFDQAAIHGHVKIEIVNGRKIQIKQKNSNVIPTLLAWLAQK